MNEPRNEKPNGAAEIQSWITQVAPYLKALAPNQLVTVGEDGFYQASNCQADQCALCACSCFSACLCCALICWQSLSTH